MKIKEYLNEMSDEQRNGLIAYLYQLQRTKGIWDIKDWELDDEVILRERTEGDVKTFADILNSDAGLIKLAVAMENPIKHKRDYKSVARQVFKGDPLPRNESSIYDISFPKWGSSILENWKNNKGIYPVFAKGVNRVHVPQFDVSVYKGVKYTESMEELFIEFDKSIGDLSTLLAIREDLYAIQDIKSAVNNSPNKIARVSHITPDILCKGVKKLLKHKLKAQYLIMNPMQLINIIKKKTLDYGDMNIQVVTRSSLRISYSGIINTILVTPCCPINDAYITAGPEEFGIIPERHGIGVKIFKNDEKKEYDIVVYNIIGLVCFPHAVSGIKIKK